MDKKKIEDYLHLYLGCEIMYDGSKCKLFGVHEAYCVIEMKGLGIVKIGKPYEQIKPILRPLSDMTEEEANNIYWSASPSSARYSPESFVWLLKQGFDLFGLAESGLAIDKTTLKK